MPRLVHESGTRFWSIALKGKQYTTTFGKVGTGSGHGREIGRSSTKQFADAAKAKAAYELAILIKYKAGYVAAKK